MCIARKIVIALDGAYHLGYVNGVSILHHWQYDNDWITTGWRLDGNGILTEKEIIKRIELWRKGVYKNYIDEE